jgi:hypothetical protein
VHYFNTQHERDAELGIQVNAYTLPNETTYTQYLGIQLVSESCVTDDISGKGIHSLMHIHCDDAVFLLNQQNTR